MDEHEEIEESEGDMEREKQGAKRYGLVTKCTMIGAMLPFAWGLGTLGSSYFNSLSGHNCADGLKYKSCVSRYEENIRSQRYSGAMGLIGSGLILISGGALSLIAGRGDD